MSMNNDESALDDPIWLALCGSQAKYAVGGNTAKRYQRDIVPFAAFANLTSPDWTALSRLVNIGEQLLTPITEVPDDSGFRTVAVGVTRQYVYRTKVIPDMRSDILPITLTEVDIPEMLNLAGEAKLTLMMKRALELGHFIGVRFNGRLVAMAGERLKVNPYCEVSEVCTTPDYAGQGLATCLVSHLVRDMIERDEIPILHADNPRAIAIYERMGFEYRKDLGIQFVEYVGKAARN